MSDQPPVEIAHWLANFDSEGDPLRLHSILRGAAAQFPKLGPVLTFARLRAGYPADAEDAELAPEHILHGCARFSLRTIDDVRGVSLDVADIRLENMDATCLPRAVLSFDAQTLPPITFGEIDAAIRRDFEVLSWYESKPLSNVYRQISQRHIDELLRKAPRWFGPGIPDSNDCNRAARQFIGWLNQGSAGNLPIGFAGMRLIDNPDGRTVEDHWGVIAYVDGTARLINCYDLTEHTKGDVLGFRRAAIYHAEI